MPFTLKDAQHVLYNVWRHNKGSYEVPCNVYFANSVEGDLIQQMSHTEALLAAIRKAGKLDRAPCCAFSITQKESGWNHVMSFIKLHPEYFQTVTTKSRHGKYNVMWVFFKTNGRKF